MVHNHRTTKSCISVRRPNWLALITSLWSYILYNGSIYLYKFRNMELVNNAKVIQLKAKLGLKNLIQKMMFWNKRKTESHVKDQGWAWVIVVGSLCSHMLNDGVIYSYGVLTTEFINHFQISRSTVGFMGSILSSITLFMAPLTSVLCEKFSYRSVAVVGSLISSIGFAAPYFYGELWFVILSSSVTCGIGFGLIYLPSIMIISIWFEKKRSMAIGIAVCGAGIGTFLFSYILENLITQFGWQLTMLITGGILLTLIPCSLTYVDFNNNNIKLEKQETSNKSLTTKEMLTEEEMPLINIKKDAENGWSEGTEHEVDCGPKSQNSLKNILINPIYLLILASNTFVMFNYNGPYMFVKDRAIELGFDTNKGSFLISSIGIGNCIGRIGFGYLASFRFVNRFYLNIFLIFTSGVSLIVSWWMSYYILMIGYTFCYGLMIGSFITLSPVILVDVFGLKLLNQTLSISLIFEGIAVFVGPPFVGWIYDTTLSYNISFLVCGAIITACGLMLFLCYISKDFREKKFTS